jgi:hypothetical protein
VLKLPLDAFADVFDRFADLPARATEVVLSVAESLVHDALVTQLFVVGEITSGLFDFALYRLGFPVELITVHSSLPSTCASSMARTVSARVVAGYAAARVRRLGRVVYRSDLDRFWASKRISQISDSTIEAVKYNRRASGASACDPIARSVSA